MERTFPFNDSNKKKVLIILQTNKTNLIGNKFQIAGKARTRN